jgi:DNA-binding LacI/PurR family transcriptional regulator
MGRTMMQMLLSEIANPGLPHRHVALSTELVVRDSA